MYSNSIKTAFEHIEDVIMSLHLLQLQKTGDFGIIRSIFPTWSDSIKTASGNTKDGIMSLHLLQLQKVANFWHK